MTQQRKIGNSDNTLTAVEWLVKEVNSDCLNSTFINPQLIEKAKQMEKEQLNKAYLDGIKFIKSNTLI